MLRKDDLGGDNVNTVANQDTELTCSPEWVFWVFIGVTVLYLAGCGIISLLWLAQNIL
jgi:hypothetical protein